MKKFLVLFVIMVFAFSSMAIANDFWQKTIETNANGPHGNGHGHGPAPGSGDCIPDEYEGPGW